MNLPDIEIVSADVHQAWMAAKQAQGLSSRKSEEGEELMVPYNQLSEQAKSLDRDTVRAVYAAIARSSDADVLRRGDAASMRGSDSEAMRGSDAASMRGSDAEAMRGSKPSGAAAGSATLIGLRSALYPVADLAAAKAWYAQLLGAEPYFDQPFYVGFEVGGFELGLMPSDKPGAASSHGPQPMWGVADAPKALARLLALGAKPLDEIRDVGEGIQVGAVLDPFGNRLGFIANPNFRLYKVR